MFIFQSFFLLFFAFFHSKISMNSFKYLLFLYSLEYQHLSKYSHLFVWFFDGICTASKTFYQFFAEVHISLYLLPSNQQPLLYGRDLWVFSLFV